MQRQHNSQYNVYEVSNKNTRIKEKNMEGLDKMNILLENRTKFGGPHLVEERCQWLLWLQ